MSDFRATASLQALKDRAKLLQQTRQFFDSRGFIEVQTPVLSEDTVVDRHLDPIPVLLPATAERLNVGRPMWLQSSPEFAMKRLLASGLDAIYEITPAFRIGESGRQHNPEFTMLEWYRCGESMQEGMTRLSELVSELLSVPLAHTMSVSQAFEQHAGMDPLLCSAADLQERCRSAGVTYPVSISADDYDTWFDIMFTELVQPHLGSDMPTIIHDYPASQAALARIRAGQPDVAERFEMFVQGVELANGYHELLDANELTERNHRTNERRVDDGKQSLPSKSRLLDAMQAGLPQSVGVALGFDRLVMLATGAERIDDVICFPIERA